MVPGKKKKFLDDWYVTIALKNIKNENFKIVCKKILKKFICSQKNQWIYFIWKEKRFPDYFTFY